MAMGRMYAVTFENVAVTAGQDFFEILPATQKPVAIHACFLSQSTELRDVEEEQLRIKIIRGHTTSGSGGSSATARPLSPADTAAGATCEINNTTIASAGTAVDLHAETFNVRTGWVYLPTPEMRPVSVNNAIIVVRLMAAPEDSVTMSGTIIFEELA